MIATVAGFARPSSLSTDLHRYLSICTGFPKGFPNERAENFGVSLWPHLQADRMLTRSSMPKKARNSGQTVLSFPGPADDAGGVQVGARTGVVMGGAATAFDLRPSQVV